MLNFIRSLQITVALSAILLGALVAIAYFAGQNVVREKAVEAEYSRIEEAAILSTHLSSLLHERQKERGLTGVFIASQGTKLKDELTRQRQAVDQKFAVFRDGLKRLEQKAGKEELSRHSEELLLALDKITGIRAATDALSIEKVEAIGYFTRSNAQMIDFVSDLASLSEDSEVSLAIVSFSNFMRGKEYAGIERATGTVGFGVGAFGEKEADALKRAISLQDAYAHMFQAFATEDQKKQFGAMLQSPAAREVEAMRAIALRNQAGELATFPAEKWYNTITDKINMQKEIEDEIAKRLLTKAQEKVASAQANFRRSITVALAGAAALSGFVLTVIIALTGAVKGVATATMQLGKGNLEVELPRAYDNEVGQIIQGLKIFRENALQMEKMRQEQKEAEANAEREKKRLQEKLASDFEQSVKGIVNVVAAAATELSQTASGLVSVAAQSAQKAVEASQAASGTTANVQAVASASEELSASVREISGQLQKTTNLVENSQNKVQNANALASALMKASDKVAAAMDMITNIASQINLLALNATIESARAGEAGKGFAVVAGEVKNLAGQTDRTALEIHAVIEEMYQASQTIISALGEIVASVGSISEAAASVASAVEEQSVTTNEIARNMQTAAVATQTISDNLQEVQVSSSHAGSASEQMLQASKELSQQAESLNLKVDEFLKRVRAA
ncbi:MAG: nitrate- and nitrite sensing domain-containing protein [Alphaproteobacteria bacterium]|nr:nitrate- and nitrite sensing domain-containing protein [Alphaproteobacteria bacterium]